MVLFQEGLEKSTVAHNILSVLLLKDDIKTSVLSPNGYLEDLRNDTDLRNKFVIAINQIYDPVITD